MRGIDLKLPRLPKRLLTKTDWCFWEVLYDDGTTLREDLGAKYGEIDRSRLESFRIVRGGETLVESFPPPGATGWNLVYRRRTVASYESDDVETLARRSTILVAWVPHGPALSLDPEHDEYRVSRTGFVQGDPDFDPPVLHPHEGERVALPEYPTLAPEGLEYLQDDPTNAPR